MLNNKYFIWYNKLMDKALQRPDDFEGEVHHIIPKSCGGSNDKNNLVKLTYREHYLAHAMLVRFLSGDPLHKMRHALNVIMNTGNVTNSYIYEENRKARIELMTGQRRSPESIERMKEAAQKRIRDPEYIEKWKQSIKGIPKDDAWKESLSKAAKNEEKFPCKYCGQLHRKSALARWHNEKCKMKYHKGR